MILRVGIAGDAAAVEALRRVVEEVPGREVAWTALEGGEAARRCRLDPPDLLLLSLAAPGLDGVKVTRRVMADSPTTILLVTAVSSADAGRVFDALGGGARDVVEGPRRVAGGRLEGAEPLRAKLALLARFAAPPAENHAVAATPDAPLPAGPLVAIGASAGGPAAVSTLLSALPTDLEAPVVIVQHVDEPFAAGLASWLSGRASRPVRLAANGDHAHEGDTLLAASSAHLVVADDATLLYTPEPRDCPYRPSIDAFLSSAARSWSGRGVAVLLTGMGRDGAEGLLRCRAAGWHTIAQDETTSALYGMPRAAREIGAATEVLPLVEIAPAVTRWLREERARRGNGRKR